MDNIESRFVNYTELERFFKDGEINKLKSLLQNSLPIGSTADILYIVEQFHKSNSSVNSDSLNKRFQLLLEDVPIFFPELDRDLLLKNMFQDDDFLWEKACNVIISPRFSCSLLTIAPNEDSYWSIDVFDQMESYYLSIESYD